MPKRWLFVTYTPEPKRPILDPSARYRCFNRVEDLRGFGHRAAVTSQQRFERDPPLDFDIYVFHRPWYSQDFEGLLDFLRRRGKTLLADLDDPVFAAPPRTATPPPFPELGSQGGQIASRFLRALRCFDRIGVATQPLADWIAEVHPAASLGVFSSGLGPSWMALARASSDAAARGAALALSPTFDIPLDHELLRAVIPVALQRAPGLRIVPHTLLSPFLRRAGAGKRPGALKPTGLLSLARHCHTIAFACGRARVDQSLPAVRALEAAFLGCRVLVPPLPDFLEHRDAGFVFLETHDDWIDALVAPPRQTRAEIASMARAHVARSGNSAFHTRRFLDWVEAEPA